MDIDKNCRLGTVDIDGRPADVFIDISLDRGKLSISGEVGPTRNGNASGGCGQIVMGLETEDFTEYAPGWSAEHVQRLIDIWRRWHLNDMVAGTPAQMEVVRAKQAEADAADPLHKQAPHAYAHKAGFSSYYDMEKDWLRDAGLLVDGNYKFGSDWLREEIPQDVIDWLAALPEADKRHPWN